MPKSVLASNYSFDFSQGTASKVRSPEDYTLEAIFELWLLLTSTTLSSVVVGHVSFAGSERDVHAHPVMGRVLT